LTADALEAVIDAHQSLYRALASLGLLVQHGEAEIRPAQTDQRLATELGVELGSLLLRILQVDFMPDDRAVLLSDERHVADAFSIRVYRKGPGAMVD
jgi:DNA-binding GntR family transcriptional regulator